MLPSTCRQSIQRGRANLLLARNTKTVLQLFTSQGKREGVWLCVLRIVTRNSLTRASESTTYDFKLTLFSSMQMSNAVFPDRLMPNVALVLPKHPRKGKSTHHARC